MSDAVPTDLQFDQAEWKGDPVAVACTSCGTGIKAAYYQVADSIVCERCRRQIEFDATHGSPVGRFAKASLLGLLAASLGAAIYYGVRALTGYEFGLIAVVVGFLVGGAVRMGSGHRGGLPYQLLAMFLTYTSIVSTYLPYMVEGYQKQVAGETYGPVARLLMMAVVLVIGFAAPFLAGFENIIGIVIIAIGLYEAWKINRKPDRTVTGPFRIEEAVVAPVPAPVP